MKHKITLRIAILIFSLAASSSFAQTIDMAKARAYYLQDIAVLKDYRAGRVSQCPYMPPRLQPGQTHVLLDLKGAGYLTHVWATGKWDNEWISFYFDGEEKPSIEGKWADIFAASNTVSGTIANLPIALQNLPVDSRGVNCYIPMPFKKSVKITMQNRGAAEIADTYFIFDYLLRQPSNVPDCRLQYDAQKKNFSYAGPDAGMEFHPLRSAADKPAPIFDAMRKRHSQTTLKPGEEQPLLDISGTGVVDKLTLASQSHSALTVRIYYDDAQTPAIDCPLDKLFGMRDSMVLDCDADSRSLYLPMPYRKLWRLSLKNISQEECSVTASVEYRPTKSLPDDWAYLHAAWNAADGQDSSHYPLFSATGRGHFVGMLLYQPTTKVYPSDHAGADYIYGDAATANPFTLRAIGGEDYFCAAYFGEDYATPFVGATKDYMHGGMRYRFHWESPIPFEKSINVDFAIFRGNSYESVAFWYQDTPGTPASPLATPWKCLGPFNPESVPKDIEASLLDPKSQPDFTKTYPVSVKSYFGGKIERLARWRDQIARGAFVDATADDVIPFNGASGGSWVIESVWYATTNLTLSDPQEIKFIVGHDDPIDVYIDGKPAASFALQPAFKTDKFTVQLAKGSHRIVVKNCNNLHPATFFWDAFSLVIEDSTGRILPASSFNKELDK
jgi:hypothetical protein